VISPTLAGIAETSLKLIGVLAQIVQYCGSASLLFSTKGRSESPCAVGHSAQVLAQQLFYAGPVVVTTVGIESTCVQVSQSLCLDDKNKSSLASNSP